MKNPVDVARTCVGISRYVFREEDSCPPDRVNCYNFVHWVYAECGVFLPRTLEGQLYAGTLIRPAYVCPFGDLIFRGESHWGAYYDEDRAKDGVGHVGILTDSQTVIHTSWKERTVVEETLEKFLANGSKISQASLFRGVYRVIELSNEGNLRNKRSWRELHDELEKEFGSKIHGPIIVNDRKMRRVFIFDCNSEEVEEAMQKWLDQKYIDLVVERFHPGIA